MSTTVSIFLDWVSHWVCQVTEATSEAASSDFASLDPAIRAKAALEDGSTRERERASSLRESRGAGASVARLDTGMASTVAQREQVPVAAFIDDIDAYMQKEGSAEAALEKLQRFFSACKMIEQRLVQKKAKLKLKLPEIQATHDALIQMRKQAQLDQPLEAHYELAQSVYAKARIPVHQEDKVGIWLGANVMLEYPREEALELISKNLSACKQALTDLVEDQGLLRDQITTTEVNMARVFNWDVKERRKQKEAGASQ